MLRILSSIAATLTATAFSTPLLAGPDKPPKLVLQITVDQLRGDLPTRYYDRLGDGGFKYLWEKGVVYRDAHHDHANTETIVGHATLATGTTPSVHGMIGNLWLDRNTGDSTYNIEDPNYHLLTVGADVDKATEIDPTQAAAKVDGRSPAAMLSNTFSDELAALHNGRSKVFGVSVKDRGAVSMAGHAGKAFWFSKASGEFITSNYYYDKYPGWVNLWNARKLAQAYSDQSWQLLHEKQNYLFAEDDDRPWETDLAGFGRIFPHPFGKGSDKYFNTKLTLSPAGDALTLDFAKTLLKAEKLGEDEVTDYLSISFSSTDYVGHIFGPSSLEAEDNILQLDKKLAALFKFIDREVGLKNTLIVLSADHGGPDTPGYLAQKNIPAGYVDPDSWDKSPAIERLKKQFNIKGALIEKFEHPYLYLSADVLNDAKIDRDRLDAAIEIELKKFAGVSQAISSVRLSKGQLADTEVNRRVTNNYHPDRSGDIYMVFKPNWFINDFDSLVVASTHGSPWRYDTFVPVVFAGAGLKPQHISRRIYTTDVATTLSAFVGAKPPSGAVGKVLPEVTENRGR